MRRNIAALCAHQPAIQLMKCVYDISPEVVWALLDRVLMFTSSGGGVSGGPSTVDPYRDRPLPKSRGITWLVVGEVGNVRTNTQKKAVLWRCYPVIPSASVSSLDERYPKGCLSQSSESASRSTRSPTRSMLWTLVVFLRRSSGTPNNDPKSPCPVLTPRLRAKGFSCRLLLQLLPPL